MFEDVLEFGFQVIEAEVSFGGKPFILDFAPEDFDEVEFGAVGWQPMETDALAKPVHHPVLKRLAGMNGRVIQDDQAKFSGAGGLSGEGIQGGDDGGRGDAPDHGLKVALMGGAHEPQDIHARARGAGEGQRLPPTLPSIGDARGEREAALIEIKQVDDPLGMTVLELA